jgi:hypothetical protein
MIENTSSRRSKEAFVVDAMATGDTGAPIEAQEARGQQQLLTSDRMPVDLGGELEAFEALGFTFGTPDPADPLFMPATLPDGWAREGSAHAMWSYIVDQHGRRRVSVFYKAAFYDRSAHAGLTTVRGYVGTCAYEGKPVVTDDAWATPEAVRDAVADHVTRADQDIAMWAGRGPSCADLLAEAEAKRAQLQAIADLPST